MSFDPDEYLRKEKSGVVFDPDEYLASAKSSKKTDLSDVAQAAIESFARGIPVVGSYLPHIQAGFEKLIPDPGKDVDNDLKKKGFKIIEPAKSYTFSRDANIARQEKQKQDYPAITTASEVTGSLVGGLAIPGGVISKGGNAISRIGRGAALGGSMGLLSNPGDTQGEVSLMPMERLENAAKGAVLGGAAQGVIESLPYLSKASKWASRKLGSALTGVSEGDIQNYAARTNEINKIIRESGGDITDAADKVRSDLQSAIRSKRQILSNSISDALDASSKDPVASIDSVINQLQTAQGKLNPNLKPEAYTQIQDTISRLTAEAEKGGGKVTLRQLNEIKEFLQDRAKSAYMKDGQIFQLAKESAQAAKGAAAIIRKSLNELSPEIATANNKLSLLHGLEDKLNKNLIAPGKSESALLAAGSGLNPRNAKMLERLGEAADFPIMQKAKDLSAARSFTNPTLLPTDKTGKAVGRMIFGSTAGRALAGPAGLAVGGALASPMTLKAGINAANIASGVAGRVGGAISDTASKIMSKIPNLSGTGIDAGRVQSVVDQIAASITNKPRNYKMDEDPLLTDPEILIMFKSSPSLIDMISDPQRRALVKEKIKRLPASK